MADCAPPCFTRIGSSADAEPWYNRFVEAFSGKEKLPAVIQLSADGSATTTSAADLQHSVDCVSAALAQHYGASSGSVIGLHFGRGIDYVRLLLACSRLGCYALPMPTDYPSERLQAIACAGSVQLVCVDGSSALPSWLRSTAVVAKVDELQRMGAMIAPPKANNDAGVGGVILPTSGSTGTPKLVQRSQASFSHRVEWTHEKHPFTKQDVCIQARVQTATHCQYELLEPLLAGVPVHVIPDVQQLGLDNFWATLTRLQVTRMNTLPTLLQATLTAGVSLPPTLTIIELVSEPVPRKLCRELQRQLPSCHLWALYGTTEASMSLAVDISAELQQSKTPDASLPPLLGVPTSSDVGVWLLDEQLRPVPGGEVGGLFLSGPQLFDCYVGMKELTREKLVDAELEVAGKPRRLRVYGTGDLAVRSADGSLILKGRSDRQVKVRGNTVHLGDIDAHLLQSRDVTQAVSVLSGDRVVSFITPKSVDESALRSELSQRMPAYMMPATVVKLAEFPQLPNGKVDLQRLGAMAKLQDSSEQPADSLSRIVHAAGGAQQPPDYVMMSHLYALSMFFVIVHHVVWENRWQPAPPRLLFLVCTVSKPIAVQTFTFLAGLQDRRYPPTTVRGALRKLALNVLLGVLPNLLWRLVTGVWWNRAMCEAAGRTHSVSDPHTHVGLLLRRWIILNLAVYRTVSLPLLLLERRLKLQGVATAVAMLPAIAICIMAPAHCTKVAHIGRSHLITPCRSKPVLAGL